MLAIDTTTTPHIGIVLSIIAEVGDDPNMLADVPAAARDVERAGLDSVWVPDVITGDGRPALESMTVLGAVAGATERIGLGTCILALPLRNVVWTAAQIQTLQYLSGGRLALGVGIGGFPESPFWRAAGAPARRRGSLLDSALEVLPKLVAGEAAQVGDAPGGPVVALQPAAAMPPLRVAGDTERGLRRAVRHGGWFGGGAGSGGPETLAPAVSRLRELAAELGVAAPRVTVSPELTIGVGDSVRESRDARAQGLVDAGFLTADQAAAIPLVQTADHAADAFGRFIEAGADEIVTAPAGEGADWRRGLELIAEARHQLG